MKTLVRKLIIDALESAKRSGIIKMIDCPDIVVEEPRNLEMGDFATNVAMTMSKSEGKSPRVIAQAICDKLNNNTKLVKLAEIAGPGFINMRMSRSFYIERLKDAADQGDNFGQSKIGAGEKVILEYVSANPTGPLHVGHGRGAAVGDTLGNLLRRAGFDVLKEYYINDVGNQIKTLGESTWYRYKEIFDQGGEFPEDHYKGDYIRAIAREISEEYGNKFLTVNTEERQQFFMRYANDRVLEGIKKDLADFRVEHENWYSEKVLHDDGRIEIAVNWLRQKGFVYDKDGAVWLKSSAFNDEKDRVIVKQTGERTYFCSDIAYHKDKIDRGFNRIIDIWGADHHGYVPRMQAVLQAMNYKKDVFRVLLVQFVTLKRAGEKVQMSTRSGEFITLADVILEVGVDAARFFFLMRSSDSHLDFDLDLAKKETSENPVYYVQYAYARICNVFNTAQDRGINYDNLEHTDLSVLENDDLSLIKKMMTYPEVIEKSALGLEVHRIPFYLQELASIFHGYYKRNRIVTENIELSQARCFLMICLRRIFKDGLTLIGVSSPEKM